MSSTLLRPLALALGYDLRTIRRSDSVDLNLKRYFAHHPVDLVVDCGAHEGGFAQMCRWAGYAGAIHSFEPGTVQFAKLQQLAARDGQWKARQIGLGAQPDKLALHVSDASNFNSLLPPRDDMVSRFPALQTDKSEEVEILRLDAVLDDAGVGHDARVFLKTDTQGYDLQVIEGAGERLSQVEAVMIEMPAQPIYDGAPDHWRIMEVMREAGFGFYAFSTVSRDSFGGLIEYDAIWKRQR